MSTVQHQEDYDADVSVDDQYYDSYADLNVHLLMLQDKPRMQFYRSVLTDPNVVMGKVVVDVGSGTGVLSCWAALSGAAHVFSIEASTMASLQPGVFADNGLAEDSVTVLHTTVEALVERGAEDFISRYPNLRECGGVGVVVSEWMGFYLFHEGMLFSVLRARDFFREVNEMLGVTTVVEMIPSHATLYAAPMRLGPLYKEQFRATWASIDGVNFSSLGKLHYECTLAAAAPLVEVIPADCLLHEGVVFWSGDLDTLRAEALHTISELRVFRFSTSAVFAEQLRKDAPCAVDGFTFWFTVSHGARVLDTSPRAVPTHWKQTTVLLPEEAREMRLVQFADSQETLPITLRLESTEDDQRCYRITVELG